MAFSTRRGRPPAAQGDSPDHGTPELQFKRAHGLTEEPLDTCLSRGIITPAQHRSGLHLRWLYTVRYGAPIITSRYREMETSQAPRLDDDAWRSQREYEYTEAVGVLRLARRYEPTMRLCVYNHAPAFLDRALLARAWGDESLAHLLESRHHHICEGLELLRRHWKF